MSINPYEPPQASLEPVIPPSESDALIVRDGKELVVPVDATVPARCAKCNRESQRRHKVTARPSSVAMLVVFGMIFLVVVADKYLDTKMFPQQLIGHSHFTIAILSVVASAWIYSFLKNDSVRFGVCDRHNLFHRISFISLWSVVALYLLVRILSLEFTFGFDAIFTGFTGIMITSIAATYFGMNISMKRDGDHYRVTGCGKTFLESFPDEA